MIEKNLPAEISPWLAFAQQKLEELEINSKKQLTEEPHKKCV